MQITSWNAFKLSLGIYLMGYWFSTISFQTPLFVYFNESSLTPVGWWLWLEDHQLLSPYLFILAFSCLGLVITKLTRITAIFNLINLLLLYRFTNGLLISPSTPFLGWCLLWLSFFPQELKSSDKFIWWILLATGYFCSGLGKALSSIWTNGDAVALLSMSPSSVIKISFDNFIVLKKIMTFSTLIVELLGIFIIWMDWGRKLYWYLLILFNLGIVLLMNVPEVGLLMLIINLALWEDSPSLKCLYSKFSILYNTFNKKKDL